MEKQRSTASLWPNRKHEQGERYENLADFIPISHIVSHGCHAFAMARLGVGSCDHGYVSQRKWVKGEI